MIEVLLVEDSLADAELVQETLLDSKLVRLLHTVRNGVDALDFLYQRGKYQEVSRPDLILLDLNLPRKDGREVLAEIKEDLRLKIIPVIVLTTSADEADILRSYQLHVNCYITKPIELEHFVAAVQAIEHFWLEYVKLPPKTQ